MMTPRETATVLAALRYWQRHLEQGNIDDEFMPIATNDGLLPPLDSQEIEALCADVNSGVYDEPPVTDDERSNGPRRY